MSYAQFVKGADIGWLSQMEATGYQFYDTINVQTDCLTILKARSINTVRLRVWVNPSNDKINGHCNKKEVATMALRAKNKGMRILIDFHYSDSWADPSKQNKPAAWANDSFDKLLTDVYNHTYQVLDTLKSIGATPDWVQVGNEITSGMLWPDGSTNNWSQLALLLNKGYDAVKDVDSSMKVIIHHDQGNNNSAFVWFFDNITTQNVKYDIIGASYYPYWLGTDYTLSINDLGNNLNNISSRYGKPVMIVEVGGLYTQVQNTYDMLTAVIQKVKAVPNNMGLGVIYWEPEGDVMWSGYNLSSWVSTGNSEGKPTSALYAFLDKPTGVNVIEKPGNIKVKPNPTTGNISIDIQNYLGEKLTAILVDLNGKVVNNQLINSEVSILDMSELINGTYVLSIYDKNSNPIYSNIVIKT